MLVNSCETFRLFGDKIHVCQIGDNEVLLQTCIELSRPHCTSTAASMNQFINHHLIFMLIKATHIGHKYSSSLTKLLQVDRWSTVDWRCHSNLESRDQVESVWNGDGSSSPHFVTVTVRWRGQLLFTGWLGLKCCRFAIQHHSVADLRNCPSFEDCWSQKGMHGREMECAHALERGYGF